MQKIERAAGGMVVRGKGNQREVLLIDDAYGHVTFPKGHLERGEDWEIAAVREVAEETGIETRILGSLGRVEYPIVRDGETIRKQVRLFLLEAIDETEAPVHQVEEIQGAYYASFDEACRKHNEHGYSNWSFVFDKAKALLDWHDGAYEKKWRQLKSDTPDAEVDAAFEDVKAVVERLVDACRTELEVCMPDISFKKPTANRFPIAAPSVDTVRAAVEHTLLKPEATLVEIENLCLEAKEHRFGLVCINPQYVAYAAEFLAGSDTEVCTVIGFPLGATTPESLAAEVAELAQKGAREIDMVIPVGSMVEDDVWTVFQHVDSVVQAAKAQSPAPEIKVILETSALHFDQVIKAAFVSVAAGAEYVKTSTGFHKGGAMLADVHAMALIAGDVARVKASGGVRTPLAAKQMLRYGAHRLGTSSGVKLVR